MANLNLLSMGFWYGERAKNLGLNLVKKGVTNALSFRIFTFFNNISNYFYRKYLNELTERKAI